MEIKQTLSFGYFMLVENIVILLLLADLIRRTGKKIRKIVHPHLQWNAGMVFMAYLLCVFTYNLSETYTCYANYITNTEPIELMTVIARVFSRTLILMAKILLWYYTIRGGFYLFRR